MFTPIIEGIDNEVLLVFGVLVAVVAILMVQYVYRSTGQSIQHTSSESTNFDSSHSEGSTQQREGKRLRLTPFISEVWTEESFIEVTDSLLPIEIFL